MTSHTHGTDHPAAHYPLTARCGAIVTDDGPGTCVGPTWTRARVLDPRLGMLPPCPVCFPETARRYYHKDGSSCADGNCGRVHVAGIGAMATPTPAPDLRRLAEARTCPFCKGTGACVEVDAVYPDGRVENPRPAVCMACDGEGTVIDDPPDVALADVPTPERAALLSLYYDQTTALCDIVYGDEGDVPDSATEYHAELNAALADAHEAGRADALAEVDRLTARVAELEAANAAATERAAIVAWLYTEAPVRAYAEACGGSEYTCAADAIERCAHHEAPK